MKPIKLLIILLPVFLTQSPVLHSQTYFMPIAGYEWSKTEAVPNYYNYYSSFRVLDKNKYPLSTFLIGFRVNKYLSANWRITAGILYSNHQFDGGVPPHTGWPVLSHVDMNLSRLRVLTGLEYEARENISLSGDLSLNHLFGTRQAIDYTGQTVHDPTEFSRMHLALQLGLNWYFNNIVLRPHFEFGFWNLKNRSEYAATRPITGFGLSLGYQFEW